MISSKEFLQFKAKWLNHALRYLMRRCSQIKKEEAQEITDTVFETIEERLDKTPVLDRKYLESILRIKIVDLMHCKKDQPTKPESKSEKEQEFVDFLQENESKAISIIKKQYRDFDFDDDGDVFEIYSEIKKSVWKRLQKKPEIKSIEKYFYGVIHSKTKNADWIDKKQKLKETKEKADPNSDLNSVQTDEGGKEFRGKPQPWQGVHFSDSNSDYTLTDNSPLYVAINRLTELEKRIIDLRYFQNLSFDEIADILGYAKSTIYDHHENAIKRLRSDVKLDYFEGMPFLSLTEPHGGEDDS